MKHSTFTFRIDGSDLEHIERIADHLQRSRSDAVRFVLKEVANNLDRRPLNGREVSLGEAIGSILAKWDSQ